MKDKLAENLLCRLLVKPDTLLGYERFSINRKKIRDGDIIPNSRIRRNFQDFFARYIIREMKLIHLST